jgi:hypothetical protein
MYRQPIYLIFKTLSILKKNETYRKAYRLARYYFDAIKGFILNSCFEKRESRAALFLEKLPQGEETNGYDSHD